MPTDARSKLAPLPPRERLIVALDVPTTHEAQSLVEELGPSVSFYKIGLELLMSGGMESLVRSLAREKQVFVDLKLPGDIPETVRRVVDLAAGLRVRFLTLSSSAEPVTIKAAVAGRAGRSQPQLLYVSFLSSLDRADFAETTGQGASEFEADLERRTERALAAGADGFIVSGREIELLRRKYPDAVLVSPGIRPTGSAQDDHKRSCTPAEAIALGADYIVVGRPIRNAPNRRDAAERIIAEIEGAIAGSR